MRACTHTHWIYTNSIQKVPAYHSMCLVALMQGPSQRVTHILVPRYRHQCSQVIQGSQTHCSLPRQGYYWCDLHYYVSWCWGCPIIGDNLKWTLHSNKPGSDKYLEVGIGAFSTLNCLASSLSWLCPSQWQYHHLMPCSILYSLIYKCMPLYPFRKKMQKMMHL